MGISAGWVEADRACERGEGFIPAPEGRKREPEVVVVGRIALSNCGGTIVSR